jgi:hypothetical protein
MMSEQQMGTAAVLVALVIFMTVVAMKLGPILAAALTLPVPA